MSARGFTLIEVLVALVIVAVGMAAVLASLTSAADTTAYLRDKSFAGWVGMNRIAELRLQVQPPPLGKSSGEVELAGRQWRWEQEVLKLDVPGTRRIDVRVRPAEADGAKAASSVITVSGIIGDAVKRPDGDVLPWDQGPPGGPGPSPSSTELPPPEEPGSGADEPPERPES